MPGDDLFADPWKAVAFAWGVFGVLLYRRRRWEHRRDGGVWTAKDRTVALVCCFPLLPLTLFAFAVMWVGDGLDRFRGWVAGRFLSDGPASW